jgi:CheY-like chemotaxis protein
MSQSQPLNILLVEHEDATARRLAELLHSEGHALTRAGSVAEARDLCELARFDVLIANNTLPDGPACTLLLDPHPCRHLPGILLTHSTDASLCTHAHTFRARLSPPLTRTAVRDALRRSLVA